MGRRTTIIEGLEMGILHETVSEIECEIYIGSDRVIRVNVDGICFVRIRLDDKAQLVVINGMRECEGIVVEPVTRGE
jgi:hypothetical protein